MHQGLLWLRKTLNSPNSSTSGFISLDELDETALFWKKISRTNLLTKLSFFHVIEFDWPMAPIAKTKFNWFSRIETVSHYNIVDPGWTSSHIDIFTLTIKYIMEWRLMLLITYIVSRKTNICTVSKSLAENCLLDITCNLLHNWRLQEMISQSLHLLIPHLFIFVLLIV